MLTRAERGGQALLSKGGKWRYGWGMPVRLKKLIGSLALVLFSIAYFWFAISVAIMRLPGLATGWHLLFYLLATLIWMVPCAAIIYWVQSPPRPRVEP